MRRPVMLTDLIKQNTILSYDPSRSPDKLNNLINQIKFEFTYEVLTVPARRWRPVILRPVMLTEVIKHNTILSCDCSRSPDTSLFQTDPPGLPFGRTPWKSLRQRQ